MEKISGIYEGTLADAPTQGSNFDISSLIINYTHKTCSQTLIDLLNSSISLLYLDTDLLRGLGLVYVWNTQGRSATGERKLLQVDWRRDYGKLRTRIL